MAYRVAIIGQSNSILHTGYVAHLMRRPEVQIGHMGRLGATPSVLLPLYVGPKWLEGHDVCVIDVAVMDQVFLWAAAIDPYSIGQYVAYAIQMIHAAGCLPLLLIIPHRAALPDPNHPTTVPFLHQIYRAVAAQHNAVLLDLTDRLDVLGRRSPDLVEAAYQDPNHLSDDFSRATAARIIDLIQEAAPGRVDRRPMSVAIPNFERMSLPDLCPDLPAVERKSSVYGHKFVTIGPEDWLSLPIGKFDRVHGLLINRSGTNAKLAIEGHTTVVKALGTKSERDIPLVAQLCPVMTPVRDRDGVLFLSLADPASPVTEASWNPLDVQSGHVEASEILIQRGGWRTLDFAAPILPPSLAHLEWPD